MFLKYPIYIAFAIFIALVVYSMSTEKPRQFRTKLSVPIAVSETITEESSSDDETEATLKTTNHESATLGISPTGKSKKNKEIQSTSSIVVAYSYNDAGGKIVLTQSKCERSIGLVAYTTAVDGKTDFGCWTNDELYIFIRWEKEGLNNYTFDRFIENESSNKLKPKNLFDVVKDSLQKQPLSATGLQMPSINAGVKK